MSDMFRGFSISGKRRSTSELGGRKSEGGLSLAGDGRMSGQWRRGVSIVRREKRVSKGGK